MYWRGFIYLSKKSKKNRKNQHSPIDSANKKLYYIVVRKKDNK